MELPVTSWLDRWRHLSDEELVRCLDRERRPGPETRLRRHLDTCTRCTRELTRMQDVLHDFGAMREVSVAEVAAEPVSRFRRFVPVLAGAGICVALAAVSILSRPTPPLPSPAPSAASRIAVPAPPAPVAARAEVPKATAIPVTPQVPVADEIEVRFAVHRACECLAQPPTITGRAGKILVEGVVSDFRRRDAVVEALRGKPNIEIRIRTYEETPESRFFPCGPRVDLEAAGLTGVIFTHHIAAYLAGSGNDGAARPALASEALFVSRTAAAEA